MSVNTELNFELIPVFQQNIDELETLIKEVEDACEVLTTEANETGVANFITASKKFVDDAQSVSLVSLRAMVAKYTEMVDEMKQTKAIFGN